jgi:pSer/pThr/pTyr-binding forkhead associated (FHA) protein
MSQGGGFCERHGPFDAPHRTCPFCALEADQRRAYGPPSVTVPSQAASPDVKRDIPEPPPAPGLTELIGPEEVQPQNGPEPNDSGEPLPPLAWLVVREPRDRRGALLAIKPNQTIGREADVRWNDPRLSRVHARFTLEPPEDAPNAPPVYHLWPFAPTNPVYINGRAIRGATPLQENDEIKLGNTFFVFKVLTG